MKGKYSIGIDLHKEVIQVCVLDHEGQVLAEKRYRAISLEEGLRVVDELGRWKEGGLYGVEALGMNRWFVNACKERGYEVVVADAAKLNLKMSGRKTDRHDSVELARRLYLGDIERNARSYYPTEEEYGVRKLLRTRHGLVLIRQQVVNQIRGICNAYKVSVGAGNLYSRKSIQHLKNLSLPTERLTQCMRALASSLESIQQSIEDLSGRVVDVARVARLVHLQQDLPSVGPQTATTLVYELGDVRRFRNAKAVAAYVGLVPRVSNSADTSHHGRLTKRGNPQLRWILSEWAVRLMTRHSKVQAWAAPRLKRMHKNKIRVALARRLLIGTYQMLRTGEAFSLERCLAL